MELFIVYIFSEPLPPSSSTAAVSRSSTDSALIGQGKVTARRPYEYGWNDPPAQPVTYGRGDTPHRPHVSRTGTAPGTYAGPTTEHL